MLRWWSLDMTRWMRCWWMAIQVLESMSGLSFMTLHPKKNWMQLLLEHRIVNSISDTHAISRNCSQTHVCCLLGCYVFVYSLCINIMSYEMLLQEGLSAFSALVLSIGWQEVHMTCKHFCFETPWMAVNIIGRITALSVMWIRRISACLVRMLRIRMTWDWKSRGQPVNPGLPGNWPLRQCASERPSDENSENATVGAPNSWSGCRKNMGTKTWRRASKQRFTVKLNNASD